MHFFNASLLHPTIFIQNMRLIAIVTLLGITVNCVAESTLEPMYTPDFDTFLVAVEIEIPKTRKIYIADASVTFSKRWLKQYRGKTSAPYRNRIIKQYGKNLTQELTKAFNKAGWEVLTAQHSKAISLTPKIYNLYIQAPDSIEFKQTIVSFAGLAGMELLFQNPKGQTIMKIIDFRSTQENTSGAVTANRVNNARYFRRLMSRWSKNSVKYLDNVMNIAEQQ